MYFHIRYVGRVNIFFTTSLNLSFDGNVPTILNYSQVWAEIEGYLLWVCFSVLCDRVELYAVSMERVSMEQKAKQRVLIKLSW